MIRLIIIVSWIKDLKKLYMLYAYIIFNIHYF